VGLPIYPTARQIKKLRAKSYKRYCERYLTNQTNLVLEGPYHGIIDNVVNWWEESPAGEDKCVKSEVLVQDMCRGGENHDTRFLGQKHSSFRVEDGIGSVF